MGIGRRKHLVYAPHRAGYRGNDSGGAEQASLDRANLEIINKHLDLLANNSRADRLNPRNFAGNFRDDAGDRGQSVNTKSRKRFQVGLNTSASTAVGACDG